MRNPFDTRGFFVAVAVSVSACATAIHRFRPRRSLAHLLGHLATWLPGTWVCFMRAMTARIMATDRRGEQTNFCIGRKRQTKKERKKERKKNA
jgi:hypothetical protein